jgi:hypothetical protein
MNIDPFSAGLGFIAGMVWTYLGHVLKCRDCRGKRRKR